MPVEFETLVAQVRGQSTRLLGMEKVLKWEDHLRRKYESSRQYQEKGLFPSQGWSAPLGVQFEFTDRCNLRCIHCYNRSNSLPKKEELTNEEWHNVAEQVAQMGVLSAVISGGEPFMRPDVALDIMGTLHSHGVSFILITNGWFIDESLVKHLKKFHYNWVQVSIDGSRPELHDRIRGVPGSWDRAVRAARIFVEAGLPTTIAHVVLPMNYPYVEEMVDLAVVIGVRQLFCDRAIMVGRAAINFADSYIAQDRHEALQELLERKQREYRTHMVIRLSADPAFSLRAYIAEPTRVCLIRPNGDVKLDCITPFVFGNVREEPLHVIWEWMKKGWQHPFVEKFVQNIRANEDLMRDECNLIPHVTPDVRVNPS